MKKGRAFSISFVVCAVLGVAGCSSNKSSTNPSNGGNNASYEFEANGGTFNNVSYSIGSASTQLGLSSSTSCVTINDGGDIEINCTTTTTGSPLSSPWTYGFSASPGTSYSLEACGSGTISTVYLYKNGNLEYFGTAGAGTCPEISGTLP